MRRAAEARALGHISTPWLTAGDRVQIEARLPDGREPFGALDVTWPTANQSDGASIGWARS
jgi:hypothetical protein